MVRRFNLERAGMACCVVALSAACLVCAATSLGQEKSIPRTHADLSAWRHRVPILVDNTKGKRALSDYQVKVVLDRANFDFAHAGPDGRDIRFAEGDGRTLLSYWIESYVPAARRAVVWVRVPRIPASSSTTLSLHYGNPQAKPASSGADTFEFFDDCETGTARQKWKVLMGEPAFEYVRYADVFQKPGGIWHASGATERVSPKARTVYGGAHATYCAWTRPMAVYAPAVGKTFFAFGNADNSPTVSFYDHKTKKLADAVVVGSNPDMDAHKNPHMLIDEQGFIDIFYRSHCTPTHLAKSARPYDISEWVDMGVVAERSSYPQPWQLKRGEIIVLYRGGGTHDATESCVRSTDGGQSWSEPTAIVATPPKNGCYAVSIAEHGGYPRKVHLAWSVTRGKWWQRYHVSYAHSDDGGATWKKSDGSVCKLPITEPASELVFRSDVPDRGVWLKDIQLDSKGNPYILFVDANTLTYQCVWRVAKCVTGKWSLHAVATSDHMYDGGALVMLADDDFRVYAPTTPSQPFQDGGEIEEWRSVDGGVTWTNTKHLTSGSRYSHNHVKAVFNSGESDFRVFWNYGDANNPPETREVELYRYGEALVSPQKMDLSYSNSRPGRLLRVSQPEKVECAIQLKGLDMADVALDARVKTGPPQMRHSMLLLRTGQGPRCYGAAMPRRQGTIYKKTGQRWTIFDRGKPLVNAPAVWHTWSFRACGDKLRLLVDGELQVEADDSDIAAGSVGARVSHSSLSLDDIRVRRLALPEPLAVVSAPSRNRTR